METKSQQEFQSKRTSRLSERAQGPTSTPEWASTSTRCSASGTLPDARNDTMASVLISLSQWATSNWSSRNTSQLGLVGWSLRAARESMDAILCRDTDEICENAMSVSPFECLAPWSLVHYSKYSSRNYLMSYDESMTVFHFISCKRSWTRESYKRSCMHMREIPSAGGIGIVNQSLLIRW